MCLVIFKTLSYGLFCYAAIIIDAGSITEAGNIRMICMRKVLDGI